MFQILTVMLHSKSGNTLLPEVMIFSKDERVFIRDLSDPSLEIIFNGWWAAMNVGSKCPIG